MSKSGWGYHWSPCNGPGGGSGGGGWAVGIVLGCVVLAAAVAKPAAHAAGEVGHAVVRGLEVAGMVTGCALGLAAAYGLARLGVRLYRWRAYARARHQQLGQAVKAYPLPAAQPRAIAGPPRLRLVPETRDGETITVGAVPTTPTRPAGRTGRGGAGARA